MCWVAATLQLSSLNAAEPQKRIKGRADRTQFRAFWRIPCSSALESAFLATLVYSNNELSVYLCSSHDPSSRGGYL